jgi:hypothetical protein
VAPLPEPPGACPYMCDDDDDDVDDRACKFCAEVRSGEIEIDLRASELDSLAYACDDEDACKFCAEVRSGEIEIDLCASGFDSFAYVCVDDAERDVRLGFSRGLCMVAPGDVDLLFGDEFVSRSEFCVLCVFMYWDSA